MTFICLLCQLRPVSAIEAPSQLGEWNVGHQVLEFGVEDGANRSMDVDLWFPTQVSLESAGLSTYGENSARHAVSTTEIAGSTPLSLIVYSHGTGGDSVENSVFAESLASHGFLVAATTHRDGTGIPPAASSTHERPNDVQAIIDVLYSRATDESDSLHGVINMDGVGVAGFSFGGFTTMAASAGTTDGVVPADPRIKAIMPIARGSFLAEPVEPADITVPTLLFAGEQDDFGLDSRARNTDFEALSAEDKFLAIVDPANHADVGWTRCQQSPVTTSCKNDEALLVETTLATAFFDRYLREDTRYGNVLTQSFATQHESDIQFWSRAITDTNRNNRADFADFVALADAFGKKGRDARRSRVDFNEDESVDFEDFLLLAGNYSTPRSATAAVPEPSSVILVSLGMLYMLRVRGMVAFDATPRGAGRFVGR